MTSDHYFSAEPQVESDPQPVALRLPDLSLDLITDRGVFAVGQVDRGTEFLLRSVPDPPVDGDILDLGCGYGVIAVTMARRSPGARVWAIDVNNRALDLTRLNAEHCDAPNIVVATPDQIPADVRFTAIYSNPPIRVGKTILHDMLSTWLARLMPDGSAHLVMHRHLGADSLAAWLTEAGHATERVRSRQGYRLLRVQARPL